MELVLVVVLLRARVRDDDDWDGGKEDEVEVEVEVEVEAGVASTPGETERVLSVVEGFVVEEASVCEAAVGWVVVVDETVAELGVALSGSRRGRFQEVCRVALLYQYVLLVRESIASTQPYKRLNTEMKGDV